LLLHHPSIAAITNLTPSTAADHRQHQRTMLVFKLTAVLVALACLSLVKVAVTELSPSASANSETHAHRHARRERELRGGSGLRDRMVAGRVAAKLARVIDDDDGDDQEDLHIQRFFNFNN
jgi:type II secretory pathway component PulJ